MDGINQRHHLGEQFVPSLYQREYEEAALNQFEVLAQKSRLFAERFSFPTVHNRLERFAITKEEKVEIAAFAQGVTPLLHQRIADLINSFLLFKRSYGTDEEKKLYHRMERKDFINRLITKRPLSFFGKRDHALLRCGEKVKEAFDFVENCGEGTLTPLKDYLCYDEIQVSAFLGVSVPTRFINEGDRFNRGAPGEEGKFIKRGIYVGLVGSRFERPGLMEWQHIMVDPKQNTRENGYGSKADPENPLTKKNCLWAKIYRLECLPSYDEIDQKSQSYLKIGDCYFNKEIYKKRMRMVIEPFLIDANARALEMEKKAYIHTVGLGLGAWSPNKYAELALAEIMTALYYKIIQKQNLDSIADVDFSWFPEGTTCNGLGDGATFQLRESEVTIHFTKNSPAAKTIQKKGKLLIASYPWDGNSYPGNEYWIQKLDTSGDPAAACSSLIPELQNPEINPDFLNRVRIYP